MHIALDGSDLLNEKIDGTTVYVREILPRLSAELKSRGHKVTVFSPDPVNKQYLPDGVNNFVAAGNRFWTQTKLSQALFKLRPDLLFLPIQTVPLYRPENLKVVATVHDLDFMEFPRTYHFKNLVLLRWFSRVVARNATRIVAVSHRTKEAVIKYYKRNANDISVVYHGYDKKTFRPPVSLEEKEAVLREIQNKYSIPGKIILFVGALQPRKNIHGLISAFEIIKNNKRREHLVLVAGNAWKEREIIERIEKSFFKNEIHVIRKADRRDLCGLYWNASVFVLPSFSEGFGLPVLEAMACGAPIVTSEGSVMEEITNGAAGLSNPMNAASIASRIENILNDPRLGSELQTRGFKRAQEFSWEKSAKETADAIEASL